MKKEILFSKECIMKMIVTETSKMSYPRGMNMFKKQVVKKKTKEKLKEYFNETFNFNDLWNNKLKLENYDRWHKDKTKEMSECLIKQYNIIKKNNREADAISAKFLNTFMHQLMKYKRFQYLYEKLHLPLDGQVFRQLSKKAIVIQNIEISIPEELHDIAKENNAYKIDYKQYMEVQNLLLKELMPAFNRHLPKECKLKSRIDLNAFLWID